MTASKLASSNGRCLDVRLDELDLREPLAVAEPRGLGELLVGDVDADHAARRADQHGGAEDVGPRPRAEVEHRLAGPQRGEVEVVADARERRQRLGGDRVEELARVAEALGQAPPDLEVQLGRPRRGRRGRYMSLTAASSRSPSTSELASSCGSVSAWAISSVLIGRP